MAKERRLGRGLEALLGRIQDVPGADTLSADQPAAGLPGTGPQPIPALVESVGALRAGADGSSAAFPTVSAGTSGGLGVGSAAGFGGENTPADGSGADRGVSPPQLVQVDARKALTQPPAADEPGSRLIELDIAQIESNPFQPRGDFPPAEIQALADSLRAHGLLQPILVRRNGAKYQLVAGERRLRAAVQAGWTRVPAQVIDADDRQLAELALVENIHRKDLNPLEKAASFQRYLREFGGTQEQLASRLKMDRSTIANLIRLLELPAAVQQALRDGRITQGHARALLPLEDERTQIAFCERIQREGWSVRQTEAMVAKALEEQSRQEQDEEVNLRVLSAEPPPRPSRGQSQHVAALEREFRLALGTNVQIIHNRRGRGRVIIHFRTHEEFERIRRLICESASLPQARAS